MIIRHEYPGDVQAIHNVTIAAFENHPISRRTEQFIVKALRDAGALSISLVAEIDGQVVGLIHEGVPPEVFLALPFTEEVPEGKVVFHDGFQSEG
ncbi:MAG: GNAT family N-acetyltransferase [Spirochaetia bacterium]